jgi:hypothetical protein
MDSDVIRGARQLVEDEGAPNRQMLEGRRRYKLVDRHVGAYGLNTNSRHPSLKSQIEGFGRGALRESGRCSLTMDLLAKSEERSREDDEHHISQRDLPPRWRRVDGLGDGDENHFGGLNRNEAVDGQWRHNAGKDDQGGILFEEYRIADWSMNELRP